MKTICLAPNQFSSLQEVHSFLKNTLNLPDYYGENLDALYDILTTCDSPLAFCLHCGYEEKRTFFAWERFFRVLQDASQENSRITILY